MEKHGFCHAFLCAKTLLLQKHHVCNSCCSLFAFFCSFCSSVRVFFLQTAIKPTPQHFVSRRR